MKITLSNLVKRFGSSTIVNQVNLEIRSGEMFFLLGSSGCGKTTILRMLAGFYDPEEGDILFGNKSILGTPPHQRNTAMVFQNYAVWPHLNVFENVAYGLRVRKIPPAELKNRVNTALSYVKMQHLAERKPTALSGGQQQRVALARAMVVNPDLLLFDEPLSNLDAKLRIELRDEIKKLHSRTHITSLYVTHDQEEALSLADRIAVMNAGQIEQVGTPQEIYTRPANPFVAQFIGEINLYSGSSPLGKQLQAQPQQQIAFRPENVEVVSSNSSPNSSATPTHGSPFHHISGKVIYSSYLGSKNQVVLKTEENQEIKAWLPDYYAEGTALTLRLEQKNLLTFS
jgi:iron(III) transport system ATP-binding protein